MRIPMMPTREAAQPLHRILTEAARQTNTTDYAMTIIASHIFEGIIREVAKGQAVAIPVFGLFAPVTQQSKFVQREDVASPRFSAGRPFRHEVAAVCTSHPVGALKFAIHCRSHRITSGRSKQKAGSRGFTGFEAFRVDVRKQAAACGIEV